MRIFNIYLRQINPLYHLLQIRKYGVKHNYLNKDWLKYKMDNDPMPPSRSNPVIMKLDSPDFKSIFTPELETLCNLFKKYNYDIRVAGGAVRDLLMGLKPTDLDFATDATPTEMKEMFTKEEIRMINMNGEKHGTITARINDAENFEITTLRIDILTDGRRAEVMFTKDWKLDANRRDLTINSMFLDLDGNVYDYFYGYDDLQKRKIVFVGHAATRIQEDYLRIFRYFRFYGRIAQHPGKHDEETIKAIKDNVAGLERISGERIWSEWSKILENNYAMELTLKMIECGLSKYIGLPEQPDTENFKKVYTLAKKNNVALKQITLIVTLLKNEQQMMNLHNRLKLSAFNRDLGCFLIRHREIKLCEKPLQPYQWLVISSIGKAQELKVYVCEILKYNGMINLLNEFEKWEVPKFPIKGHLIRPHVTDKRKIGEVLLKLKRMWMESDFQMTEDDLTEEIPKIVEELKNKQ